MEKHSAISRRDFIKGIGTLALSACLPPRFAIEAAAKVIPAPPEVVADALSVYDIVLREFYLAAVKAQLEQESMLWSAFIKTRKNSNNELLEGKRIITPIRYGRED